jgi:hypothetical protein
MLRKTHPYKGFGQKGSFPYGDGEQKRSFCPRESDRQGVRCGVIDAQSCSMEQRRRGGAPPKQTFSHSVSSTYPDNSVMVRPPRLHRKQTTSRMTELNRPPQQRIECPTDRQGTSCRAPDAEGEGIMAHLLLIDDDPA